MIAKEAMTSTRHGPRTQHDEESRAALSGVAVPGAGDQKSVSRALVNCEIQAGTGGAVHLIPGLGLAQSHT